MPVIEDIGDDPALIYQIAQLALNRVDRQVALKYILAKFIKSGRAIFVQMFQNFFLITRYHLREDIGHAARGVFSP